MDNSQTPVRIYTQNALGEAWIKHYQGQCPIFACVLGFTETGLIPGISAAGATPADRTYTAIADAEFLYAGSQRHPTHALPPLHIGISPVFISRAVIEAQKIPLYLFNAGLPHPPAVPCIDLKGSPARCLSQGQALTHNVTQHLFNQGLIWGRKLALEAQDSYLILGECVVGGTTTALAILMGLGIQASGKVNSSHPICNHGQKLATVQSGLEYWRKLPTLHQDDPLWLLATVGDPMQIVVAGMAIAASQSCGVILAGGTQMLAIYALAQTIAHQQTLSWQPDNIIVGTTRWVVEEPTGDTVNLARLVGAPLLATQANFSRSKYPQLQIYEQNYVKEGVGAGGCAIAANLYQGWGKSELLDTIEELIQHHFNNLDTDKPEPGRF